MWGNEHSQVPRVKCGHTVQHDMNTSIYWVEGNVPRSNNVAPQDLPTAKLPPAPTLAKISKPWSVYDGQRRPFERAVNNNAPGTLFLAQTKTKDVTHYCVLYYTIGTTLLLLCYINMFAFSKRYSLDLEKIRWVWTEGFSRGPVEKRLSHEHRTRSGTICVR